MKTILLVLLSQLTLAQDFSGQISYIRKIIPKNEKINVDSALNAHLGDSALYTISGPYYKSTFFRNGKETYTYTCRYPEYRFYHELANSDYMTFSDARAQNVILVSFTPWRDSISNILGYPCYMAEKIYESSKSNVWYSDSIRINPDTFEGHQASDWHLELTKTNGAFTLRSITDHGDYIEIYEAVKITRKEINEQFFDISTSKQLVASEYTLDKQVIVKTTPQVQDCYNRKVKDLPNPARPAILHIINVTLVVTDKGEIQHVSVREKDRRGLYKIAIDVVKNCGLKPVPGEINGKPVSSECVMRIGFNI